MRRTVAMSLWCFGTILANSACSNDFAPTEAAPEVSLSARTKDGGTFQLGDFALYLPDGPSAPRAVLVALGGPKTRGFVTGEPFGAPIPVEAALQGFGQSLRQFAADHRIAILGTSHFGPTALPSSAESDELILDALRAGAEASGRPELTSVPILDRKSVV